MNIKQKLIYIYLAGVPLFTLYSWLFGATRYRGFFYNLGQGLVWPVAIFPALGAIIGGVVAVVAVVLILTFGKRKDEVDAGR